VISGIGEHVEGHIEAAPIGGSEPCKNEANPLRMFGCVKYTQNSVNQRTLAADLGQRRRFQGYQSDSLWTESHMKVVIVFDCVRDWNYECHVPYSNGCSNTKMRGTKITTRLVRSKEVGLSGSPIDVDSGHRTINPFTVNRIE
jgi:hypothetical protein